MTKILSPRVLFITGLIVFAAASRFLPHPPNFTPVAAMALFGGALFNKKILGFLVPITAMFISDLFIGFHDTMWSVYLSIILITGIGLLLHDKVKTATVIGGSVASSLLFFVVTNFAVWNLGGYYPTNFGGLIECYVAAVPFFNNGLLGDLFYSGILFGGFYAAQLKFPKLAEIKK